MAIGACVGRATGMIVSLIQQAFPNFSIFSNCNPNVQCVTPATYAMVGAAAFLSGTTRITVSLTVIMFELTGALSYVLPIMMTVLAAKWVGDYKGKGVYDALIRLGGYPFLDSEDEYIGTETVQEAMTPFDKLEVITGMGLTVETLEQMIQKGDYKGYPVIQSLEDRKLIGYAGRAELRYALAMARKLPTTTMQTQLIFMDPPADMDTTTYIDLRPWIESTPTTLPPVFTISLCVELFKKLGLRYVVINVGERVVGIVTKKDLLRFSKFICRQSPCAV
jgi:chloride channel 3/4/5